MAEKILYFAVFTGPQAVVRDRAKVFETGKLTIVSKEDAEYLREKNDFTVFTSDAIPTAWKKAMRELLRPAPKQEKVE